MLTHFDDLQKGVRRYVDSCNGNQFEACIQISEDTRKLLNNLENCISEKEALSCVLNDKLPDNISERKNQHMNLSVRKTQYMKNLLSYVENDDIVKCVEESFAQSTRLGHLTFYYPVKLQKEQKTRVRVLTRMCWFNR